MSGGGGGESKVWIGVLVAGIVMSSVAMVMGEAGPAFVHAGLLAVGGLFVVFGSCEAMIKSVEGIGGRLHWNRFVAGTMAGLASNIPEMVMLGFVVAKGPRFAFIVVAFTLHLGALAFGIYAGLLPRDARGHARLPEPLVQLSTDLYACAGAFFFATGTVMLAMHSFSGGAPRALSATDLYVLGASLIFVEVVAVTRLVKRFSKAEATDDSEAQMDANADTNNAQKPVHDEVAADESTEGHTPMSVVAIVGYGLVGMVTSVLGGHAVGEFADVLVTSLTAAGYSEMVGALLLSLFACAGAYVMIATAHVKGLYDIALANVSGAVTQVPFVVMPAVLIFMAALSQTGVVPMVNGGVLPVDLETTSVVLLGFPAMLILWKSIQDDGTVNWVETASMIMIFGVTVYFLAVHG